MKRLLTVTAMAAALAATAVSGDIPDRFEVVEDHTAFVFSEAPVNEAGMPVHGNAFITEGYIYPAGTLADGVDGTLPDGSPAFPDKVLGTWTCDGWFVGEALATKSGTWLISRQIFDFGDGDVIVTQGTELVDKGVANPRPVTGAAGEFSGAGDTMWQTSLGFNGQGGATSRFAFEAPRAAYREQTDGDGPRRRPDPLPAIDRDARDDAPADGSLDHPVDPAGS